MSFADLEAGNGVAPSRREPGFGRREDPSRAVAAGVFQISTAVNAFQRLVNSVGTPRDTPELREKIHKTRLRITDLVKDTSAKLRQASEADHHAEVSASKRIGDAKLAKDFQSVLKEFQKVQQLAAEKQKTYSPHVFEAATSSSFTSAVNEKSDATPEQHSLILESKRQELVFFDNEIVFNEAIIEEREQGIKEIHQQIGEVNEIFKDLAVLVHDQGTMIDDIQSNIESSHSATAQARTQLAKASKTQRSNSSLACLLLVIFGIVALIVVVVLVS